RRAFARLAVDLYVTAGLLDETVYLAEPETRAGIDRFCREERLEGAVHDLLGHAGAVIGHRDHDVLARQDLRIGPAITLVEKGVAGFECQLAAVAHRVARIDREVQQRAFEFIGIDLDAPQPATAD